MIRLIKHINNKNVIWKIKKMKKNSNDFDIIDFSKISPQKFEDLAFAYINIIFTEKGTEILPTRYTKDGGKDICMGYLQIIN